MSISCDYREHKCIEEFKENSVENEIGNLINGDFIVKNESKTKRYVIERKTMDDLSSSIIDGRYKEQIERLTSIKSENTEVMFIIEGFNKGSKKGVPYSTLLSTMQSIIVKYGIYVMRSKDVKETCQIIKHIADKIEDSNNCGDTNFAVKKKSHTLKEVYLAMLMSIPGISQTLAQQIRNKYSSIHVLCKSLEENGHSILTDIPKIGNTKALSIYNNIMNNE